MLHEAQRKGAPNLLGYARHVRRAPRVRAMRAARCLVLVDVVDRMKTEWRDYRRGLVPREAQAFDAIWERGRGAALHVEAQGRAPSFYDVALGAAAGQEEEMRALRAELARRRDGPTCPTCDAPLVDGPYCSAHGVVL